MSRDQHHFLAMTAWVLVERVFADCRRLGYSAADAIDIAIRAKQDFWRMVGTP